MGLSRLQISGVRAEHLVSTAEGVGSRLPLGSFGHEFSRHSADRLNYGCVSAAFRLNSESTFCGSKVSPTSPKCQTLPILPRIHKMAAAKAAAKAAAQAAPPVAPQATPAAPVVPGAGADGPPLQGGPFAIYFGPNELVWAEIYPPPQSACTNPHVSMNQPRFSRVVCLSRVLAEISCSFLPGRTSAQL